MPKETGVTKIEEHNLPPDLTLHAAAFYDLTVWLMTLGRERAFRQKLLRLACLEPGETVLDVGCGTGSLAIVAKRQVGPTGSVYGIDASLEMLVRAGNKAGKADLEVIFRNAAAQSLPFPDAQFDAVLTTIMLHHLPRKARTQCAREIKRVLKPGGRVLAVEFAASARKRKGPLSYFHRHGHVSLGEMIALFRDAGLNIVESGAVGYRNLQFVIGTTM